MQPLDRPRFTLMNMFPHSHSLATNETISFLTVQYVICNINSGSKISHRRSANHINGRTNLLTWPISPQSCIKMKKIHFKGGRGRPWRPFTSANEYVKQLPAANPFNRKQKQEILHETKGFVDDYGYVTLFRASRITTVCEMPKVVTRR